MGEQHEISREEEALLAPHYRAARIASIAARLCTVIAV